ncbi:MAG: hypothetical protein PHY43_02665 [Verrucomicrobiales bacterium]|nr:hypothetical protein [Verrucomicrobiales bacterium]
MKTIIQPSLRKEHGGTILLTALLVVVFGSALASYLLYSQNEYTVVARSQVWNNSLVLAEAGAEEAMAMVNKLAGTTTPLTNWGNTASASADGWNVVSTSPADRKVYWIKRALDSSSPSNYYVVYVTNVITSTSAIPAIVSTGYAYWNSSRATFSASSASRTVFVQTAPDAFVGGGILAWTTMDFKGNNVIVDSFDSSDPAASLWQTNRFYRGKNYGTYTVAKRQANAIVGTDGLIINVGNADIYGYVDTGPGGTASVLANGSVGDLAWVNASTPGIQTSPENHARDDMNINFTDATLPTLTWNILVSAPQTIGGIFYDYCITNNLALRVGGVLYYAIPAQLTKSIICMTTNAVLYLPAGLKYGPGNTLTISTNSDLAIYTGDAIDTGNGVVNNINEYAPAFKLYGLPACTSIKFGGNAIWVGYMYAPSASVEFNGGGTPSVPQDVIGSLVCHDVKVNGHYNFHFDETLKTAFPPTSFIATYWQEK